MFANALTGERWALIQQKDADACLEAVSSSIEAKDETLEAGATKISVQDDMLSAIREGVQLLIGLAQKYAAGDLETRLRFGGAKGRDDCSGKCSPG